MILATTPARVAEVPSTAYLLTHTYTPNHSLAARIFAVRGLRTEYQPEAPATLVAPQALSIWGGFYTAAVLANGWEPFDQPIRSAYLPVSYRRLDMLRLESGGAVVFQKLTGLGPVSALRLDVQGSATASDIARAQAMFAALLLHAGIPDNDLPNVVAAFSDRLAALDARLNRAAALEVAAA